MYVVVVVRWAVVCDEIDIFVHTSDSIEFDNDDFFFGEAQLWLDLFE